MRAKNALSVKKIASLKTKGYYADGQNLYLQVSQTGTKSWLFMYKRGGVKKELGLGSCTTTTLLEARAKAADLRKQLNSGIDVALERQKMKEANAIIKAKVMTFSQCAALFLNKHQHELKNAKGLQQWNNTLAQYVEPVIGSIDINQIDTEHVLLCLQPIWLTKNETANRIRGRIERVLNWATVSGYRGGLNPARWRGHLDNLLPKPSKVQISSHFAALSYNDIPAFMAKLKSLDYVAALALQLLILTATRTSEVIGATWQELDLESKIWTIPAGRMKASKEHRIPLSEQALLILERARLLSENQFVFSGQSKGGGLSNGAFLALLKRLGKVDITAHGFRSSFRDWAAETTDYPNEVLEKCLAHTIKNQAEAAYRRGDMLDKRLIVMQNWADYCCPLS